MKEVILKTLEFLRHSNTNKSLKLSFRFIYSPFFYIFSTLYYCYDTITTNDLKKNLNIFNNNKNNFKNYNYQKKK